MENPKEEPKTKCYCGHTSYCDCIPLEPKQETLEEAAEKYIETSHYMDKNRMTDIMFGAKWQQEQNKKMYSEEEVEILLETLSKVLVYQGNEYRLPYYFEHEIEQVIKQFKKK